MRWLPLIFLFAFTAAFASEDSNHQTQWRTLKAQKPAKASLIPSELIEKVKESFGSDPIEKKFMSADVFLFDDHHVIDPPVHISTPVGGGTINLDALLPEGKAKFSMRIKLSDPTGGDVLPDRVYFVPKISLEKDGQEVNCGKFFEITETFNKQLTTEAGMESYLTQGIYASLFVGTYVFVKKLEDKVLLSNLNLTDERFMTRRCPQLMESQEE